jgi:hypothetical protein
MKPNILACIPCYNSVQPHPFINYLILSQQAGKAEILGHYSLRWMVAGPKTKTVVARNHASLTAMGGGATHLLLMDDDMVVPYNMVECLLAHDVPIAAPLFFKTEPVDPLCFDVDELGAPVPIVDYPKNQLFKCPGGVGTGVMLIKVDVLKAIEMPIWHGSMDVTVAEDIEFCKKAKSLGFDAYCDSSIKCGQMSTPYEVGEQQFNFMRSQRKPIDRHGL